MSHNQVYCFDFTLSREAATVEQLSTKLKNLCKKWVFQLERGDQTGYEHYQGRISLKTKKRLHTLKNELALPSIHLSITSGNNRNNDFYVTKEDTRVDGPWRDSDKKQLPKPWDLELFPNLLPFQQKLADYSSERELRKILYVYEPNGCKGKTIGAKHLMWLGKAELLPPLNNFKDLMRVAFHLKDANCYLIDMPRALRKDKLAEFYAGIETIKSGFLWDDRYTYKRIIRGPPQVVIFSNTFPDMDLLSRDRWDFRTIDDQNDLVHFIPMTIDASVVDVLPPL